MTEAFYAILKASFQGSIVILAVMMLRLLLKRAPKEMFCLLWLLAGLRLVLPFEIQSSLSLQPRLEDTNLSVQAEQPVQVPDILIQNPEGQPLDVPADPVQPPELPEENWENIQMESFLYGVEDGAIKPIRYGDIAAGVWILGLAAMLTASAVSYFRLKRRVREAYLIENGCFECPGLETAFVLGFFPPKIYLPMGLSDREKKFIFDHENTHIARHDHWFKLLGYAVLSIHWFNPLVWLAYHLLCRDMELACDEHVVKHMSLPERKAYSAALLSCGSHTARIAACPVAFGESNPKRRIMNVLNYKRPSFWICLLAVAAVLFVAVCLLTSPEAKEEAPENELKWNLELKATDVTPSGVTVEFIQHGDFPERGRATLQFGSHYTLEKLENGQWVAVEMLPQEYDVAWTMEAYMIEIGKTATRRENWEWLYGELPAGHYRIGKDVDLFRTTGDWDSEMFYAEFDIAGTEPEQPVWTMEMTDEEYLTMCRNAVAELQSREQFHISETLAYFTGETEDSRSDVVFWRDGENWLRQSYVTRMRENRNMLYYDGMMYMQWQKEGEEAAWNLVDSSDGDLKGMTWLHWLRWDSQSVNFEGTAQEGEELKVSVTVHATPPTLGWDDIQEYNILFFFDKTGTMTRAIMTAHRDNIKVIDDLRIETTLGSNIHRKLEAFAAQRPDAPQVSLTDEQWLEKCRTALEEYQSQGTWAIQEENSFWGLGALNSSSMSQWFGNGDDYLKWAQIPEDGGNAVWWDLQVDGASYHCNGYFHKDGSEDWKSQWEAGSTDSQPISPPWPLWYDWKGSDIEFVEQGTEDSADYVTFTVQESPHPEHSDQIAEYQVTFRFRNDVLHIIELTYQRADSQGGGTRRYDLYAFAPVDGVVKISQCYEEALLQVHGICNDPECTNTDHDHYGIACTVEHCTNPAHGHGDQHHSDDHHD